jgi:hypothetical protein
MKFFTFRTQGWVGNIPMMCQGRSYPRSCIRSRPGVPEPLGSPLRSFRAPSSPLGVPAWRRVRAIVAELRSPTGRAASAGSLSGTVLCVGRWRFWPSRCAGRVTALLHELWHLMKKIIIMVFAIKTHNEYARRHPLLPPRGSGPDGPSGAGLRAYPCHHHVRRAAYGEDPLREERPRPGG